MFLLSTGPSEGGEGTVQGTTHPTDVECLGSFHACPCALVVAISNLSHYRVLKGIILMPSYCLQHLRINRCEFCYIHDASVVVHKIVCRLYEGLLFIKNALQFPYAHVTVISFMLIRKVQPSLPWFSGNS